MRLKTPVNFPIELASIVFGLSEFFISGVLTGTVGVRNIDQVL